uniref:Uncharacterized protein n=1 Tax=Anguilla anguilla TaxID=7936 RepID=A0A0E9SNF6_ANGAN
MLLPHTNCPVIIFHPKLQTRTQWPKYIPLKTAHTCSFEINRYYCCLAYLVVTTMYTSSRLPFD